MKTCTKCGEVKALDAFHSHKSKKDGLGSNCNSCSIARNKIWRQNNKDKEKLIHSIWYAKNKEKAKVKIYAWRKENPEKVSVYRNKWRKENPEKIKEQENRSRDKLLPGYVAITLKMPVASIPPEMLAMKRQQLEIHRLLGKFKTEIEKETT